MLQKGAKDAVVQQSLDKKSVQQVKEKQLGEEHLVQKPEDIQLDDRMSIQYHDNKHLVDEQLRHKGEEEKQLVLQIEDGKLLQQPNGKEHTCQPDSEELVQTLKGSVVHKYSD